MERAIVNKHDIKPENIKELSTYLIYLKFLNLYMARDIIN